MHTQPTFGLRHLVLAAALLAAALPLTTASAAGSSWTMGERVQGNGVVKKQAREVGHFTGVGIGLAAATEIRIGATEGVTIETDENLLPLIETTVEKGVLHVRASKRNLNLQARTLKVVINARQVDSISQGGSGSIESDALKAPRLEMALGGSGSINVKGIESEHVSLTLGGSGNLKIGAGSARDLSITIGGSGDVDAGQVKASDVSVTVGGSGQSTVWAKDSLSYTIAGSGDVNYYGDPRISKTVLGSGGAKRLGAAPR
jgi:hypothetical protein